VSDQQSHPVPEAAGHDEPEAEDDGSAQLAELEERYAQLDDRYKRALADLDNYRKRAAAEVDRRVAESREALLRDWLQAVDSVERALRMASPEDPLFTGLRAVLEQMEGTLARQGLTRVGAPGEQFDPERHEAVDLRPTDEQPDRTVVDVARSGWASGDRVLRPAQVVVAREPAQAG
jgi:molecular chaperone GrpE